MSLLDDITKTLELIPAWKRMQALPQKIEQLEMRIAELEQRLEGGGDQCPKCKAMTFMMVASEPDLRWGRFGTQCDYMQCSACGHEESRLRKP